MNLAKWMLVAALAAGTAMAEDATKTFEVVKRTPVMAASATDVGEGEDVTVIATLVDAEDATGTVFVYVGGDEYSAAVEDGAANVIVSELAPGYYSATVEYSGDDTYFGVSANVSFKVGRPQEEVDGVVWYYEPLEAGTAVVTGVAPNHATRNLTMPERLGGLTVTAVGGAAFHGCADLRSMAIPDSVTEIGSKAFRECTALTNVTLGAGVTNIGDYAFEGCTSLASVAFPEGLAGIEQGAFLGSALTDAKLPDTTERIGEDVFAGCKALTNVWLGTGIESVGVFAFHLSTNLAAVWVPVEKAGTDLLEEARVPAGCEIHYYGTQVVTFDPNGGECGTATNGYTVGEAYGALPEARREGFAFDGWWDEAAGEEVAATNTVTEKAARTVVAHWSEPPAPPSVSNVVARQRWPWNGLVDVDYEVGGDTDGLEARISFAASDGRSWVATNFLAGAEPSVDPGPHRATWDTKADGATNVVAANVVATVCLERSYYTGLYLVTEDYTVSDDGTQILDRYEEPVDPANLPTRQTIEFGAERTFKVIGAVPDAASPGSVLYSIVEDAEPVLATDADTIANAGFRVSVARTASAGDTATIQAVRHGVKSGVMTIAAVPFESIFVCNGKWVLSDDGSKLYDSNYPDDPNDWDFVGFIFDDFLFGVNFGIGAFNNTDVSFQLIAVDTVQEKLVRIDVKDNPGDEDAKVLLSGDHPESGTLNLAGSCVHVNADATSGALVFVSARYRGLESDPNSFIITVH